MAGIYIHIPFCKQACHYCNFHFSTSLKLKNDFLQALLKEIIIRKDYLRQEPIQTIYFGGGTPSLLLEEELSAILKTLKEQYIISPGAEITLEANPDDISAGKAGEWRRQGINRLSIGVQSFFEEDLKWMNRAHSASQAIDCIRMVQHEGLVNLSIDLIYGTPTLPDKNWIENLDLAVSLGIPHLSCYALTVEPGTALDSMTRKKKVVAVSNDDQARQFLIMTDLLQARGYDHYEISNLALPGKRSAHNSAYWKGVPYAGFGPSAHSFHGSSRQWNVANNALYIQSLNGNEIPFEIETLSADQRFNEYIMVSLRTMEGTDITRAGVLFGESFSAALVKNAAPFIQKEWLYVNKDKLILTREGKLFADGIAADLFAG